MSSLEKAKSKERRSKSKEKLKSHDSQGSTKSHSHEQGKVVVPRPNSIITCIYGVLSNQEIHQNNLDSYLKENLEQYFFDNWNEKKMLMVRDRLFKEAQLDRSSGARDIPKLPRDANDTEHVKAYADSVLLRMNRPLSKSSIIHKIKDWIWAEGYDQGKLKTHVYADVSNHLKEWRMNLMIKLYSYALGDPSGQKLFLQSTLGGDLTSFFNNFLMTTNERRKTPTEYAIICRLIRDEPKNLLFLTSDIEEARAASASNLQCVLVNRGTKSLEDVDIRPFKMVGTFDDLEFLDDGQRPCC